LTLPKPLARELGATIANSAGLTPSVSLAYAKNGEVVAMGWGADPGSLFQAASISKSVSAFLALCFVGDGKLSLDRDITKRLHSWSLPALETHAGKWRPRITLRQLLCHGAGLSVFGFPGYKRGEPVPTLLEILDGRRPANTDPVRSVGLPGLAAAYSGGGYVVLQQLIEDVAGRPFQEVAAERIFEPLGMESASFEQPLPRELEPRVAAAFSAGRELEGGWYVYPELAAAGLWCAPTDLVLFAKGIQAALEDERDALLPQWLVTEMVTPQFPGWGLGVGLSGTRPDLYFGHTGGNAGYRCEFIASARRGPAAAVMTNSDEGGTLVPPLMNQLARGLGWSGLAGHGLVGEGMVDFRGAYETPSGSVLALKATAGGARLTISGQAPLPFEIVDAQTLATADGLISVTLHADLLGSAAGLTLRQQGQETFAARCGRSRRLS
jgi:CubicO group peptidase (beta-lactamase class C family)